MEGAGYHTFGSETPQKPSILLIQGGGGGLSPHSTPLCMPLFLSFTLGLHYSQIKIHFGK